MHSFQELATKFAANFNRAHFPEEPATLYAPNNYMLEIAGKRVRPVACLMANELFGDITDDAWNVAAAVELFHNFTLIHDDIMDNAPLRRGKPTVAAKYGDNTAILSGDVMLIKAYQYINTIQPKYLGRVLSLFSTTAAQVCEGQQWDMDFEQRDQVAMAEYIDMIKLKTSVLFAASLQLGAILGGAGERNQELLYQFGINLGLAFQIQDDYLDVFGDSEKFGKQVGGDILSNKKTFLVIHALEAGNDAKEALLSSFQTNMPDKVQKVTEIFKQTKADQKTLELKAFYLEKASQNLKDMALVAARKHALEELANFLVQRDY